MNVQQCYRYTYFACLVLNIITQMCMKLCTVSWRTIVVVVVIVLVVFV